MLAAVLGIGCWWLGKGFLFWVMLGLAVAWHSESVRREAIIDVDLHRGKCEQIFEVHGVDMRGDWAEVKSSFAGGAVKSFFKVPEGETVPQVGDLWQIAGWLECKNINARDARKLWVKGRGSYAKCVKRAGRWNLALALDGVKRDVSRRMGIGLEDKRLIADLNRAMLIGTRGALPSKVRKVFADAGTIHVFAISGLHVMVVAQIMATILMFMAVSLRWRALVLVPMLWLYVAMIGATPSAVRAATMASIYFASLLWYRKGDMLAAWEMTLIGFALVDPQGFWSVGSVLSFVVVLGILLVVRGSRGGTRGAFWIVPVAAWAAGVPIVAHVFSRVMLLGVVANLAVVPMAALSVMMSVCGVLASYVSTWAAVHFNNFAAIFTQAMMGVSWIVVETPGGSIEVTAWPAWMIVLWYVGCILIYIFFRLRVARRRKI